ncbi:afadin- and alpha-actinin-binding protein B [Nematostella vectensis]|uniref:afadin- and alpha-actinin-binding protein B n=1 Tax=Nematostella vectensis TaxID=45351 RepID=UPI00207765D4|nr:afadin- and alpha-actinin-binding protein B [Nematostella vectensis]
MNEQAEWGPGDFLARYTTYSSRPSPDRTLEDDRFAFNTSLSPFSSPDKQFCRRDNVDQCIAFLNQEVGILGFPSLFAKNSNSHKPGCEGTFDIVRLINTTYELLQLQQQNQRTRTSLEERNLRSECDNEFLITSQNRLKEQVESLQREIAQSQENERQLQGSIKKLKVQLKNETDEVRRLKMNAVQQKKQFAHDKKKQEREMNKLKERMHQMLSDRSNEKRIGMEILNSLHRADGKRATWKTGQRDEREMYSLLVTNYEARQKELMKENCDLRDSLQDMQTELVSLLNQQQTPMCDSDSEDSLSVRSLPAGHFNMPYELVREGIEKSLRDKWRVLRSRLDSANKGTPSKSPANSSNNTEMEETITKLSQQLDNYRHIVEQQESLIETLQSKESDGGGNPLLDDSRMCEEWERLQQERALYEKQKESFDEERKNFTDAAVKLGHERKKFEEERTAYYKQQLMITPQSRTSAKSRSPDGRTSPPKLQFSTPMFSPAPRKTRENRVILPREGPITSPTTEDLYHALSIKTPASSVLNETPKLHQAPSPSCGQYDGSFSSGSLSETKENQHKTSAKSLRIHEHAEQVKRALQLKQSPSCE